MPYITLPPSEVAKLPTHSVTREHLAFIRDPRNLARYKGVYGHRHGGSLQNRRYAVYAYRARVFKFFELGSNFATPEDAARAVVAFYLAHCGERWQQMLTARRAAPWRVRRLRRDDRDLFAVDVYVRGCPRRVTHADVLSRTAGASERFLWPTRAAAKNAAHVAMRKWFLRESHLLPVAAPGLMFWRG